MADQRLAIWWSRDYENPHAAKRFATTGRVAETRAVHDSPLPDLLFRAQTAPSTLSPERRGAALLTALDQDRRLPRGLRLLSAERPLRHQRRPRAPARSSTTSLDQARRARAAGATRFCMGAAWREVRDGRDFDSVLAMVRGVRELGMEACVTLGMLTADQARRLKEAGLTAYNHNLDTSREFYGEHHHDPRLRGPPRHARATCAPRASRCARAASSAWASRSTIAARCWSSSQACPSIPRACR